jgi:hypothetical protein
VIARLSSKNRKAYSRILIKIEGHNMPTKHADELPNPTPVELNRIVSLAEASRLSSLSVDTLRDRFPEKIVRLSPKRTGMRVGHALMLKNGE